MADVLHKQLTHTIIGVYYDVYNGTSRTYPEFIYESAMRQDLLDKGVGCQRQPEYEVYYKGKLVGAQRLDLFVAGEVVVEIKVAPELTRLHKAQTLSYLKVLNKQIGIFCNFGSAQPEFERFYLSINNLKAWLRLKQIPLGILVNFYPASLEFRVLRG